MGPERRAVWGRSVPVHRQLDCGKRFLQGKLHLQDFVWSCVAASASRIGGRFGLASDPRIRKEDDRPRDGRRFKRGFEPGGDDRREHAELHPVAPLGSRKVAISGGLGEKLVGREIGATYTLGS